MAEPGSKPALLMRDIVKDANHLKEKRLELNTLRQEHSKDWSLNREFYRGNQWTFWNDSRGAIETIGVDETHKPRYKVRLTANVTQPGVQQLVAQMTKTRPVIRATPDSGADRDIKAAEMAERLYEYWWGEFGLGAKLMSALTHAQISQGYWLISWDPLAGRSMKVIVDPENGQPIWDDMLADGFRDDLKAIAAEQGFDPAELLNLFEQQIYLGDIDVHVLDGFQVWLDPTATNFEDCKYAICKFPMTVDEVQSRYGKKVTPNATTGEPQPALMYTEQRQTERPKNVRDVYFLYHRPDASLPQGAYVVWIEEPNEILLKSKWEFPFHRLPLVKFSGIENPGDVYDLTRGKVSRPLQKELNNLVSGVGMHKNLTMRPQMLAPVGSLRTRLTDEPGAVIEFAPFQGLAPEWRSIPPLPTYVFEYLHDVQARIDRVYNILPTERNQLPARTDSGTLVELMQEAVADQISPEIQRMERSLAAAGEIMAAYAQKFYAEPRLLKIKGPGGSVQVSKFLNSDIAGGFSFSAEAGSGLPRTRAGQVAQIKEMIEMGVLSPQEAVYFLPVAGLKGIQQRMQADEEMAHRHIEKLLQGEPINVPALEQALMQVQSSGQNPMTGDFFKDEAEAIAFVEQAALTPLPHTNIQVAMYVIGQHMKSVEFERYDSEAQGRFYQHYGMLQEAATQNQVSAEPVKTTLSLKGTVGPTVASEILQQGGIKGANPETMAEQPLETSVYDSMDKPDADEAGNDPLTDEEKLLSIQQAAATHTLKMSKAQREMARANEIAERDDFDREEERLRAAEDRETKYRRDEEMHQERLRAQRRPRPKAA